MIRKISLGLLVISSLCFMRPLLAYEVRNGEILDSQQNILQLRGVNWFGAETSDHVPHGLWVRNWKEMIAQIKSTGFNAVRLPICPGTLAGANPQGINYSANPDLVGLNALGVLDIIVREFDRQGIYVLMDHHRLDCNSGIAELWYGPGYSEQSWIADLVLIANHYRALPHFLGIDLKNEPHGAVTWGTGKTSTDWNKAVERASAALLAVAPDVLIFVEGIQDNPTCSSSSNHWWGGNLAPIQCTPLAVPANRLVLSPHVYGPDVFAQPYFSDPSFPANMPVIWDQDFGSLHAKGYAIAIGETGGKYGHGGQSNDKIFQNALFSYLVSRKIAHVFYWSWNPNSGDTGGILQDDWTSVWQDKVDLLGKFWSGTSVSSTTTTSSSNTPPSSVPSAPVTPSLKTLGSSLSITSDWGAGYCAQVTVSNTFSTSVLWTTNLDAQGHVTSLWSASYVQSGTQIQVNGLEWNKSLAPGTKVAFGFCADRATSQASTVPSGATQTTSSASGLQTQMQIQSDWGGGYCANVTVTNPSGAPVTWQINLPVSGIVSQSWNARVQQIGNTLNAAGLDWNRMVEAHASRDFGFCATR